MARKSCVALLSILLCMEARSAVNVGVVLDNTRGVSAVIGAAGGTLTATAADGTVFTLTIPVKALISNEKITMTPVAQATNLPFSGGLVAAVQLEPSGLRLFKLATLTVTTPRPIPLEAETPMAWHRDGRDLYLHPLIVDPRIMAFKLSHFSGVGVSNGTGTERAAQASRIPCDQEAAVQQRVMPIVEAERQRVKQFCPDPDPTHICNFPPNPAFNAAIQEVLVDYYNFTIKPMMAVALQSRNDDILYSAILRAWTTVTLLVFWLGENDPFAGGATLELYNFITDALKIWSDDAFKRCIDEHKIEDLLTILSAEHTAQNLPFPVDLGTQSKLDQCGSLELVFDSLIVQESRQGPYFAKETMHASSTVPIRFQLTAEPGAAIATAPLRYNYQFVASTAPCTITVRATDDTFAILDLELNLNPKQPEDVCKSRRRAAPHAVIALEDEPAKPGFELVSMTIDPGHPTESAILVCPDGSAPLPLDQQFVTAFETFHVDERPGLGANRYKIEKWTPGDGGTPLLRKLYNQDFSVFGATFTEVTKLELFHRPTP